jgi:hypothetical protein
METLSGRAERFPELFVGKDEDGFTPADMAVCSSSPSVLHVLQGRGLSAKGLGIARWRLSIALDPLCVFPNRDPSELVKVNTRTWSAEFPHWDCTKDDKWTLTERGLAVPLLLEDGVRLLVRGIWGKTPLHYACTMGHADVTIVILKILSRETMMYDQFDWTPLHYAVKNGHTECVEAIVKFGPTPVAELEKVFASEERDLELKFRSIVCSMPTRECDEAVKATTDLQKDYGELVPRIVACYGRPHDAIRIGHMLGLLPWSMEAHPDLFVSDKRKVAFCLFVLRRFISDDMVTQCVGFLALETLSMKAKS